MRYRLMYVMHKDVMELLGHYDMNSKLHRDLYIKRHASCWNSFEKGAYQAYVVTETIFNRDTKETSIALIENHYRDVVPVLELNIKAKALA